jgi:hypothetical protein
MSSALTFPDRAGFGVIGAVDAVNIGHAFCPGPASDGVTGEARHVLHMTSDVPVTKLARSLRDP